jgi:hypothetical protein
MSSLSLSRRRVLQQLGLGAGMLPLLGPNRAFGQTGFPRRLLIVVQTNGTIPNEFFPVGAGSDLAALTFPQITKPLEKHRNDLLFVENLEMKIFNDLPEKNGGAHDNYGVMFTGEKGEQRNLGDPRGFRPPFPVKATIDHVIHEALMKKGVTTPKLHLGVQIENAGTNQKRCFWRGKDQSVSPENNPTKVAAALLGGSATASPDLARAYQERRTLLDFVGRDVDRFARRFGGDERQKIDAHLKSVQDIESQLKAMATAAPTKCAPAATNLDDPRAQPDARYKDIMSVQLDMAVVALACNATRIATVQLNNGHGNGVVYSWLGLAGKGMEFGVRDSHDLAHRPGTGNADKIKVENWYAQQFAALIDKMKAIKEGSGTLLDNTCVLWVNHMGNGGAHNSTKLPWVIAGRCGGYFKTGQFRRGSSVPTNGLLHALASAMEVPGIPFGDPAYGGELSGLR